MNFKNNDKVIVKAQHFTEKDYRIISLWSQQRFSIHHQFEFQNKAVMLYESSINDIDIAIHIIMIYGAGDAEEIVRENNFNPYQDILKVATWIVYQTLDKYSMYYKNECDVSQNSDNTTNNSDNTTNNNNESED